MIELQEIGPATLVRPGPGTEGMAPMREQRSADRGALVAEYRRVWEDTGIPVGLCLCGCGARTTISVQDHPQHGWVRGEPMRYARGHNNRGRRLKPEQYQVEDRGYVTPCWVWQLHIGQSGYGSISVERKPYPAHRYFWEQVNGPVPEGLELDHLCRVQICVNPDHLEAVTHSENCRRSPRTKLTVEKVQVIKRLLAAGGSHAELGRRYGVKRETIRAIAYGRTWKDV